MSTILKQKSSLCPTNGRQTVGDGASLPFDIEASVLAVCHLQGTNDMYYYSTTFSGGPGVTIPVRNASDLSTPPLTPDDDEDSDFGSFGSRSSSAASNNTSQEKDTLDFLMNLFPHHGLQALPYARRLPGKPKTLYVDGKSAESVSLRESIVALLDLADESLGCSTLVIVLERVSPNLGALLHSLYPVFQVDPAFVLVGLEI
ncbi:hypothetical protein FPV67DRAFT_1561114 [Lyophyllum atratum]|nr:hypothetical protein FPV67DRAFT_1561114 [Lyophyllum atratum]